MQPLPINRGTSHHSQPHKMDAMPLKEHAIQAPGEIFDLDLSRARLLVRHCAAFAKRNRPEGRPKFVLRRCAAEGDCSAIST